MSTDRDSNDAEQMLKEIHNHVVSGDGPVDRVSDIRWTPAESDTAGKILKTLSDGERMTASEVVKSTPGVNDATRPLVQMYRAYLVNRDTNGTNIYSISEYGEKTVLAYENQEELQTSVDPWENTDLSRNEYIALELVNSYAGRPESKDINGEYLDRANRSPQQEGYAVTHDLSSLFRAGYLGRPTFRPYIYWLTDKGKEALQ